jgi:hypothetical protein
MQLRTVDGKLTLGSVYKVIVWGWLISWSVFMVPIFLLIVVGATLSGQMSVNGEMVYGSGQIFVQLLPMIILLPIIIVMHAFMFGGMITLGVWIYRHFRPLTVTAE